ncbi:MAG: ATP-binding protein [Desulfuromonadales bacterium]|nr:ATP-binding protein [Desulfuromonadales bacterium]
MEFQNTNKPVLPRWAETVRQKYLAGEASVFILYGNVFDRTLLSGKSYGLVSFLADVLLVEKKQRIFELCLYRGLKVLHGGSPAEKDEIYRHLEGKGLAGIFESLERRMREYPSNALIIPYAGSLLPAAEPQFLSLDERSAFIALHRWSLDEELSAKDNLIILIAESLAELNPALPANPRVAAIEIPMPDRATRDLAIHHYAPGMSDDQAGHLADQTAGLRIVQLATIVASDAPQGLDEQQRATLIDELLKGTPNATERAAKLAAITSGMTPDEIRQLIDPARSLPEAENPYEEMIEIVRRRKRELIEKECSGLIEFIEPRHGLDAVGGNEHIKTELMEIARMIKSGDRSRAPMGLLAVGAMGAGKTFVIKAFLKEAGLSGIALKNFRSKWVGSTEANLERVLSTVKAMGPIALVIDEGDRSFGNQSEDSDGGTSSRVIARLKEFMSDPENRGQVLFILMTNRPDKLDTDIKRPGRLDRKIPFFYAETAAERAAIVSAILGRYGVTSAIEMSALEKICAPLDGYSNADLEALTLLALEFAEREKSVVDEKLFVLAIDDFLPPREVAMLRYMEMLAVFETSRRSLLPQRFRSLTPEQIQEKLTELRLHIKR